MHYLAAAVVFIPYAIVMAMYEAVGYYGIIWPTGVGIAALGLAFVAHPRATFLKKASGFISVLALVVIIGSIWSVNAAANRKSEDRSVQFTASRIYAAAMPSGVARRNQSGSWLLLDDRELAEFGARLAPLVSRELAVIENGSRDSFQLSMASELCGGTVRAALRPLEPDAARRFDYNSHYLGTGQPGDEISPNLLNAIRALVPEGPVRTNIATCGRILRFVL